MNRRRKRGVGFRLTAGIILVLLGLLLVGGLIALAQQLLISGAGLLSGWGDAPIEETVAPYVWETDFLPTPTADSSLPTPEPEELVEIPIEKTPEELAMETAENPGNSHWAMIRPGLSSATSDATPTFATLADAQKQITQNIAQMKERFEIYLTDPWAMQVSEEELRAELVLMTAEARCHFNMRKGKSGLRITMIPTYYPGSRMVRAWRQNDLSELGEEEQQALEAAIQVVRTLWNEEISPLEMEKRLHDWMCLNMDYEVMEPDYEGEDVQRVCSALGGLLDGRANCQGYADTFYVLASLAGFEVSRQNGRDWLGGGHMWNTIKLDGKWYALDVTGDDIDDEEAGGINYIYFNLGRDMCADILKWAPHQEVQDVTEITDENYYYFAADSMPGSQFGGAFEDLDEMGGYFFQHRLETGEDEGYAVLMGQTTTADEMHRSIQAAVQGRSSATAWTVWTWNRGGNTYYVIRWTKF